MPHARNVYSICSQIARTLWTLRWCIDLAGGGENDYWRHGNMHCAGVYLHSRGYSRQGSIRTPPSRRHFIYSTPTEKHRLAPWSIDCLSTANRLFESLLTYEGQVIPRLALAYDLRDTLTRFDARKIQVRFQLTVTALETFFIAPTEKMFLWDCEAKARIRQICTITPDLTDDFFNILRQQRNDAVHRGGLNTEGKRNTIGTTVAKMEDILRETLCWGILNQAIIANAFDRDEWPI